ncbi:uncharacterized protein ACLA_076890 [Aspergillus clavatus NRRL 1]|uniref:Uncharacterized protein n=1 Tax=Aspergillus clavatus (strain ATCC 1007 / CBS 513.65 / DSM 816 / NCTC 3887 / NRRL 1 / QM 1276 / 107) TaxID=344612 RepID=A1C8C7_ASPCL|nr:uncharacterized protein ACLA_076890 [Aspergillus clavatus NRRL 1]EAW14648.1 hypothetical protein ACLA_076890 [Aspergillus clavatus NRRL 1]
MEQRELVVRTREASCTFVGDFYTSREKTCTTYNGNLRSTQLPGLVVGHRYGVDCGPKIWLTLAIDMWLIWLMRAILTLAGRTDNSNVDRVIHEARNGE